MGQPGLKFTPLSIITSFLEALAIFLVLVSLIFKFIVSNVQRNTSRYSPHESQVTHHKPPKHGINAPIIDVEPKIVECYKLLCFFHESSQIDLFASIVVVDTELRTCTRNETPLILSWERIPRLDSGVRVKEYLLEFTSEYGIPESLHPELPGLEEPIVEFLEGKVSVYTKFFEFANYRIPISQFIFDILGYYQIHLSQLSVIGAAKVSHFEINCRVLNIIPTLNLFRVFCVPSYNSGWMSFSKRPGKNTPKPLNSLKNWNNRFFWVDERIFLTVVEWRTSAPKDKMPLADSYSAADMTTLDTHRTPIKKQTELLLCLVGLNMDLFNLISAPNPTKMEDTDVASGSSGTPFALEKSPLDLANEDPSQMITDMGREADQVQDGLSHEILPVETATTTKVVQESGLEKEVAAMGPPV
ncbi:hypothetical protein Tco_1034591, partial [Tanacetum coccineum]